MLMSILVLLFYEHNHDRRSLETFHVRCSQKGKKTFIESKIMFKWHFSANFNTEKLFEKLIITIIFWNVLKTQHRRYFVKKLFPDQKWFWLLQHYFIFQKRFKYLVVLFSWGVKRIHTIILIFNIIREDVFEWTVHTRYCRLSTYYNYNR